MILALNVADSIAPVTLKVCSPVILVIVASAELNLPAFTVPVTVRLSSPLILVMFALVALKVVAFTVPDADSPNASITPDTVRLVSVPTAVMLG